MNDEELSEGRAEFDRRLLTPVTTDKVWTLYENKAVRLSLRLLEVPPDTEGAPTVLIEGDALSLECLAKYILAIAYDTGDCGCEISPTGPGSNFFDEGSQLGVYIHRLPCSNG